MFWLFRLYLKRRFFLLLRLLIIVVIALSILGFLLSLFVACLEYEDKGQALQQAEQRCGVEVNRQNLCNGSFVVDTVESVVNWFMAGNSYKECVFSAINSGKSSDAVGALTGLLAGIYYGLELKNGVKGFETMESYIDSFIQYLNHPTL